MNRNAHALSAAHSYWHRRLKEHVYPTHCEHARVHSTVYGFHSNNRGYDLQSTTFTPFSHRRWMRICPEQSGIVWICVKQLPTQSSQSENYSNKDMLMVELHSFNQTFESEWILIEEAHLQSHTAINIVHLNSFIVLDTEESWHGWQRKILTFNQ